MLFLGLGLVVAGMYLLNLTTSPDFVVDEVLYGQLGQHIATQDAISLSVNPFLVHPPLYFLVEAGWFDLTGNTGSPILSAVMSARVLNAILCAACAVVTGITARDLVRPDRTAARVLVGVTATLLVATNGFMLSFGRTALMEPAAVAAGSVIVLVAHRLRHRPAVQQIVVLGVLIGLGTLVKQTVFFAALTPLLAAALMRDRRRVKIAATAVIVGGLVWFAFPVWAGVNGHGAAFWSQQTVSVRRLLGLLRTTGVNLPNGSPTSQFLRTFLLYSSGYASLALGIVALVILALRGGRLARFRHGFDESDALPIAFGILSYGFLVYSFGLGAGNQQLVIYSAPASGLLCAMLFFERRLGTRRHSGPAPIAHESLDADPADRPAAPDRPLWSRSIVSAGVLGALLILGGAVWSQFYLVQSDDGTARVSSYVAANIPACVPINATGANLRWQSALPANPVRSLREGPSALDQNVHLFLLSPKDARYQYGNMSSTLAQWITTNGRLLFHTPSRSSESLELWQVGVFAAPVVTTGCLIGYPGPSTSAPSVEFLMIVVAAIIAVGAVATAGVLIDRSRRRSKSVDLGLHRQPED